jgi:hypothetical protein
MRQSWSDLGCRTMADVAALETPFHQSSARFAPHGWPTGGVLRRSSLRAERHNIELVRCWPGGWSLAAATEIRRRLFSVEALVDEEALVRPFSPGSTLELGLKGFHRRGH